MDATKLVDGGYWLAYWYNGYIVGSEISRGLDLFRAQGEWLHSQNEIDAAKLVHMDQENVQGQPQFGGRRALSWPARTSINSCETMG